MTVQILINGLSALLFGMLLGAAYYGGLWLTVKRLTVVRHPALLIVVSSLVRTFLLVTILYFLFGRQWLQILLALAGMLITRWLLIKRIQPDLHPKFNLPVGGDINS